MLKKLQNYINYVELVLLRNVKLVFYVGNYACGAQHSLNDCSTFIIPRVNYVFYKFSKISTLSHSTPLYVDPQSFLLCAHQAFSITFSDHDTIYR